ncbi:HAD-IC family P-type ATPase [Candidatus Saccharibacteria bacterium]|nr:HAD-IC family P-type ATPase [Candidatus Saccharibacteria bacterium]
MSHPSGLSFEEVEERVKAGQYNKPIKSPSKSVARVIFDNTFTYFNGVFATLAVILITVRSYRDLTFLGVVLANTLIGIMQELRTKKTLDRLTMIHSQKAEVIRENKNIIIPINELVIDDIIKLKAGNQIPVDAVVLDGSVSVNEALITGEADEIPKNPQSELLSGSFVVSGECYAKVTKVGAESYISKLTLQAKAIKNGEQSEIIRSLNRIVKIAGIAIIPVGALLFGHQFFINHLPIDAAVQNAASAVLGMIPEGLFLLASVSLAISAVKLAQSQVLVHEMKCIETLARVDVLCVDKTGTITSPDMNVKELVSLKKSQNLENIIANFVKVLPNDNATMAALKKHFKNTNQPEKPKRIFGFSSKYKYSAVEFDKNNFVLGAPEFALKSDYDQYKNEILNYARKGYRVLAFGEYNHELNGEELTKPIQPLALIILENPVRKTAPETFKYFREQGVAIKVISGDNAMAVAEVARQAGIKGNYIDASTLKSDEEIADAVEKYTVFGRVTPEQKRKFVKALQAKNHRVAMTGDGVNDVLALKDADCSVAMASGSDAAVQTAQLVLLESDFAKMPAVVREGRRVVNNLERSGSLFIVKNVFSFLAAALTLILGISYPMLPAQVSMLSVWTIGLPSFFLAQMPNEDLIKGRFISNILSKAIPGGIASTVAVFLMVLGCKIFNVPTEEISTACTLVFAAVSMIYLFRICLPFNLYRAIIYAGCATGLAVCFTLFRWVFRLAPEISATTLILAGAIAVIAYPLLIYLPKLLKKPLNKLANSID